MFDVLGDAVTDEIAAHWRDCESDNCPLCPFDDPDVYDHARQLARFDLEDSVAEPCP